MDDENEMTNEEVQEIVEAENNDQSEKMDEKDDFDVIREKLCETYNDPEVKARVEELTKSLAPAPKEDEMTI